MSAGWFTQPRFDLGGASTEGIITHVLDCLACIGVAAPDDDDAIAMSAHGIEGARDALDHLIADAAICVVAHAADLAPAGLQRAFDAGRFDAISADLSLIIEVGRTVDLPEAETVVREAIDAQAAFVVDLNRGFQNII